MSLLSIVVTTRNRPQELRRALTSLSGFLTFSELIVIDDSDQPLTDPSVRTIADHYVYKHSRHRGVAKSRNLGLKLATGQFILFLDDDDYLVEGAADRVMTALLEHGMSDIVFFQYANAGTADCVAFPADVLSRVHVCNFAPVGSFIFRNRPSLPKFDESLATHEDWDFLLKLFALHPSYALINQHLLQVNRGPSAEHRHRDTDKRFYKDFMKVYRRYPYPKVEAQRQQMLSHLFNNEEMA